MTDKRLNPQQIEAVKHLSGPLLIIAGAGTGKTTVITERIKYLILKKNILPSQILALTFTDKAAHEMEERVDVAMPYGYTQMWISTFHAFCDRVLRDDAHAIGLDPGYKLISEGESVLMLKKNIFDMGLKFFRPLGNPTKFLDALITHFLRLKDEDISPNDYIQWVKKQKASEETQQYLELANSYKKYEELKVRESVMDFSDLISNTLLLFRERKNILKKYQNQFKFILVDEFQDTNYAQNELAMALAGDDKNITVVADDDQSIYRFRGAAISNVLQFKKNFPKSKTVTLNNNYRSTQPILDAAYRLIQHNNPNRLEIVEGIDKRLRSHSMAPKKEVELIHENRSEDEADIIARTIKKLTNDKFEYKDIAILVRANNHAQLITAALQRHRIPFQFLGPGYLFQQEEVKDLIAYLMFLTNLSDSVSLFRVLCMDIFNIPYIELNYLLNFAKKRNLTLFEALFNIEQSFLKPQTQEKLINFREMAKRHLEKSKKSSAGQVLYYFLVDSKLFETLSSTDSIKEERKVQNIAKFFDRVKNFESDTPDANIFTLVDWLNLMLQMGDSPQAADIDLKDRDAVNILTVHSSKGLEFKVVFLVNLVSDRFPTRERSEKIPLPTGIIKETISLESDFHMEEERRLFYVGVTRAKERLYFTAANYYGGGKRAKKLSPFIYEALPKLQEQEKEKNRIKQLSLTEILSSYEEKEENPPAGGEQRQPIKLNYITFSNLQMFDICPLHYKAKVIFNIPTDATRNQTFGISLHKTLYNFYKKISEGNKSSLNLLLSILKKEWLSEGYANKKDEREKFSQAVKILGKFYKTEYNSSIKPLGLELPFSFVLKNSVKVFGKIDRIDKKGNGIEIIDYKTGLDNPKADKAHRLQLAMYALAATRVKDNILSRNPQDITLTLHFLEENTKKSMNFKQEDLNKLELDLIDKIYEIEKSDFLCSKNVLCINCEYKMLCQV